MLDDFIAGAAVESNGVPAVGPATRGGEKVTAHKQATRHAASAPPCEISVPPSSARENRRLCTAEDGRDSERAHRRMDYRFFLGFFFCLLCVCVCAGGLPCVERLM